LGTLEKIMEDIPLGEEAPLRLLDECFPLDRRPARAWNLPAVQYDTAGCHGAGVGKAVAEGETNPARCR